MQNLQECTCTGVLFQPATCKFIEKRRRHLYFSMKIWEIFSEKVYYGKPSTNWFWMENFTKNGEPTFLFIKRYRKVKEQTLRGKACISQILLFWSISLKYLFISYYFQEKICECFRVQLSVAVSTHSIK